MSRRLNYTAILLSLGIVVAIGSVAYSKIQTGKKAAQYKMVQMSVERDSLVVGEKMQITTTYEKASDSVEDAKITYMSSDEEVIRISEDGVAEALSEGSAMIVCMINGKTYDTHDLDVISNEEKPFDMNGKEVTVEFGREYQLAANLEEDEESTDHIVYESTNTEIAEVDEEGKVKILAIGDVEIYATLGEEKKSIKLHAVPKVEEFVIAQANENQITIGKEEVELETQVKTSPEEEVKSEISYAVENTEVAEVKDGTLIGKNVGKTTLTVSIFEHTYTYEVVVTEKTETTEEPEQTVEPTVEPTEAPVVETPRVTEKPIIRETPRPTRRPVVVETERPTLRPTLRPTVKPTVKPTLRPTKKPVVIETPVATRKPVVVETTKPTKAPVVKPTKAPEASEDSNGDESEDGFVEFE